MPGRTFPVKQYFLEDCVELTKFVPPPDTRKRKASGKKANSTNNDDDDDDEGIISLYRWLWVTTYWAQRVVGSILA